MVHTGIKQAQWQLRLPKASVEAIDELIQVFLQIFAGDSMVSSQQERFKVANSDVYPGQPFIYLFWRCNTAFMVLGFAKNASAMKSSVPVVCQGANDAERTDGYSQRISKKASMAMNPVFPSRRSIATLSPEAIHYPERCE